MIDDRVIIISVICRSISHDFSCYTTFPNVRINILFSWNWDTRQIVWSSWALAIIWKVHRSCEHRRIVPLVRQCPGISSREAWSCWGWQRSFLSLTLRSQYFRSMSVEVGAKSSSHELRITLAKDFLPNSNKPTEAFKSICPLRLNVASNHPSSKLTGFKPFSPFGGGILLVMSNIPWHLATHWRLHDRDALSVTPLLFAGQYKDSD